MSLILWYKLDNATPPLLGVDSSDSSLDMTNTGVTSFSDPAFGNVAYFNESSYLDLTSGSVPAAIRGTTSRMFSFWVNTGSTGGGAIHSNGASSIYQRNRCQLDGGTTVSVDFNVSYSAGTPGKPSNTWLHCVNTYEDSSSPVRTYVNGIEDISATNGNLNTGSGALSIGRDPTNPSFAKLTSDMSDFRVYDDALEAVAISSLTTAGSLDALIQSIDATTYTHLADIT